MPSFDRPHPPETGPSPWIIRFAPLVRAGGSVLDVAAGHGRHSRYLLGRGHRVTAVDCDVSDLRDLERDPACTVIEADLETGDWPFEGRSFDAIVVTNYLHRPHFRHLVAGLAPGGVLLFDTFAAGNERFGRPRNPAFLLQPGELLRAFADHLQVVAYECGVVQVPKPAVRQRICAVRGDAPQALAANA